MAKIDQKEELSILTKKFEEEFGDLNFYDPTDLLFFLDDIPKKNTLNNQSKDILSTTWETFENLFWKNEVMALQNTPTPNPIGLIDNEGALIDFVCPTLINDSVALLACIPISIYDVKNKKFAWLKSDLKKTMCGNWFEGTQLETVEKYTNIDVDEADALALFFRTLWFDTGLEYKNEATDAYMETTNLMKFVIQTEKSEEVVMYGLVDMGIPDPEYTDKISGNLGIFHMLGIPKNNE